jgi:hypothetical protein
MMEGWETESASGSCTARSSVAQTGLGSAPPRRYDDPARRTIQNRTPPPGNAEGFDGRVDRNPVGGAVGGVPFRSQDQIGGTPLNQAATGDCRARRALP